MRWVRTFYAFQFFFGLLIWLPIFYQYQREIGLSDAEIFAIQSIYYVVFCFLEIPTGLVADRFGYRSAMILGALTLVGANLMPIVAPTYLGMTTHFLLIALARSFVSGASSAYLYSGLHSQGERERYQMSEGGARAVSLAGKVVFWSGVGALMQWKLTAPYWLTVAASVLSVCFALRLPEHEKSPQAARAKPLSQTLLDLGNACRLLVHQPRLPLIMAQGVAIFVLGRVVQVNLFQPLLLQKGVGLELHGIAMALMTLFEAAGSFLVGTPHGRRLIGPRLWSAVSWFSVAMALTLLALLPSGKVAIWWGLSAFSFVIGLAYPLQRQLMNDAIPKVGPQSAFRATFLSIESIVDRAANAAVAVAVGYYVAQGAVGEFLVISLVVTIVLTGAIHVIGVKFVEPVSDELGSSSPAV